MITRQIKNFFHERDPDFGFFCQAFAMFLANMVGLLLWLMRLPFSSLIITAPGIILAIIFAQFKYRTMFNQSLTSGFMTALFMIFIIMLGSFPTFTILFTFCFVYFFFASPKTRYVVSFSIVPCVLAFNMPPGALSAADRAVEAFISAFIAFFTAIFIKELFYKRRIKSILLRFTEQIEIALDFTDKGQKDVVEKRLNNLSLNCIKVINKERVFFRWNIRKAELARPVMYQLLEISRAVLILRGIKTSNCAESLVFIGKNLHEIKLTIQSEGKIDFYFDLKEVFIK